MPFEFYFGFMLLAVWGLRVARRHRLTKTMVRHLSLAPAGSYRDELTLWVSNRHAGRWLVDAAYQSVKASPTREAIIFYNDVAARWNDEIGWANRSLIFTDSLQG